MAGEGVGTGRAEPGLWAFDRFVEGRVGLRKKWERGMGGRWPCPLRDNV
jgi:hypothetical protein